MEPLAPPPVTMLTSAAPQGAEQHRQREKHKDCRPPWFQNVGGGGKVSFSLSLMTESPFWGFWSQYIQTPWCPASCPSSGWSLSVSCPSFPSIPCRLPSSPCTFHTYTSTYLSQGKCALLPVHGVYVCAYTHRHRVCDPKFYRWDCGVPSVAFSQLTVFLSFLLFMNLAYCFWRPRVLYPCASLCTPMCVCECKCAPMGVCTWGIVVHCQLAITEVCVPSR